MNDRDPLFAEKAVVIIELLLRPPTDGPLFCVDEKTGIGVRMPTAPDQRAAPGRPVRREFEYVRNGTVDLLAGFRVNDGRVCGVVRPRHRSREFCELLELLDRQTPAGLTIHVIVDPVSLHSSAEVRAWLASRPWRTSIPSAVGSPPRSRKLKTVPVKSTSRSRPVMTRAAVHAAGVPGPR